MNGKKRARGEKKKPAAAPAGDDAGAMQPPAPPKMPLPDAAAPPANDGEPSVGIGGGGVEEEEEVDEDEQVERFYALLANIRAMRGLLPSPYASCAGGGGGDAGSRKRLRAAEPPWRPAFRMEDFEVEPAAASPAPSKKTKLTTADGGESAPELPRAAVRPDSGTYKD